MFETDLCSPWRGEPALWPEQALISAVEGGIKIWPWSTPFAECGTPLCLEPDHLTVKGPTRLSYPPGQCVYCGLVAQSRDHIVPTAITGRENRSSVLTVPSCSQCNSAIGASLVFSIPGRRQIAHDYLRRKYRRVLQRPDYTREEIDEFEGMLREAVISGLAEKRLILDRLAWPTDPAFDARYLEQSGVSEIALRALVSLPERA